MDVATSEGTSSNPNRDDRPLPKSVWFWLILATATAAPKPPIGEILELGRPYCAMAALVFALMRARQVQNARTRSNWRSLSLAAASLLTIAYPFLVLSVSQPVRGKPTMTLWHQTLGQGADKDILNALKSHKTDIVTLIEVTPSTAELLKEGRGYQFAAFPRANTHGTAIGIRRDSGWRIASARVINWPSKTARPMLEAKIEKDKREVPVLVFHATRPSSVQHAAELRDEIASLRSWMDKHPTGIVVGDFNQVSWAPSIRSALKSGYQVSGTILKSGSWPSTASWPLRIPIDHVLTSQNFRADVMNTRWTSSDHLGQLAKLQITR